MADTAEFHARRDEMESTVYEGITNLIQKAYNEENPRGRNAASLAVVDIESGVELLTNYGDAYREKYIKRNI